MVRFDAYSATSKEAKHADLIQLISDVVPPSLGWSMKEGRGLHTFGDRVAFRGADGKEFASVMWGGQRPEAFIEVKGQHTPEAVEALRARFPHRCTRVDSCADFDAPRAFERLYRSCRAVKKAHGIIGGKAGDWEDFPERGRTLYLGSKNSVSMLRLYEKGKQKDYQHLDLPNLARLESQIRPQKEAKDTFSTLSALDVWGASRWTRDIAAACLKEHVDPHPAGTVYRLSERDAALNWMCKQYGTHLMSLAADLGGWDVLGLTLSETIKEQQKGRQT